MPKSPDYYSLLKISRHATQEEIREAYFNAARRLHPDVNKEPGETEFFLDVQAAYEVLNDPSTRAQYDINLPPEETPPVPFQQTVIYSRKTVFRSKEPQLIYVLLKHSPTSDPSAFSSPPLNLSLVLDRSTSMKGMKMDMVKATVIQILHRVNPQDIFSVVAFNDRAEVIIPMNSSLEMTKLEARIQMLQNSGGTEIFKGLEAGFQEVSRNANGKKINHIILLTDGQTYGDHELCMELAGKASQKGIGISGIGVGDKWNDPFLDALGGKTGGSTMYVSSPDEINRVLLEKLDNLWKVYAENGRLQFDLLPGVDLRYAFRLQPESGDLSGGSPLKLGYIPCDGSLRILFEFLIHPGVAAGEELTFLSGKVDYQISTSSPSVSTMKVVLSRPVSDRLESDLPPQEITEALSRLSIYRLQEQVRLEVNSGEFNNALTHLKYMATNLLSQGEKQLARTVLLEADNIMKSQSFSPGGDKQIKYGTRALLMPGKETSV